MKPRRAKHAGVSDTILIHLLSMGFISRLKEKPSHVKTQYAFVGAVVVTGAIALVWTTTLPARFGAISASLETVEENVDVASVQDGLGALLKKQELGGEPTESANTETYTNTEPEGALGGLTDWSEPMVATTTNAPDHGVVTNPPSPTQVPSATTTPPVTAPKPTVILIGTTTKKAE
jgi:hypothetical protein